MCIVDIARLPENNRGNDPRPEELPEYPRPPNECQPTKYFIPIILYSIVFTIPNLDPSQLSAPWQFREPQFRGCPRNYAIFERRYTSRQ
jgi:hypothetical protein